MQVSEQGDMEKVKRLKMCLKDLIAQIMAGPLVDEMGHDFRMNDAFIRAVALLDRIETSEGDRASR